MNIKQRCTPKVREIISDVVTLSIFIATCSKIDINIISGKLNSDKAKSLALKSF